MNAGMNLGFPLWIITGSAGVRNFSFREKLNAEDAEESERKANSLRASAASSFVFVFGLVLNSGLGSEVFLTTDN